MTTTVGLQTPYGYIDVNISKAAPVPQEVVTRLTDLLTHATTAELLNRPVTRRVKAVDLDTQGYPSRSEVINDRDGNVVAVWVYENETTSGWRAADHEFEIEV